MNRHSNTEDPPIPAVGDAPVPAAIKREMGDKMEAISQEFAALSPTVQAALTIEGMKHAPLDGESEQLDLNAVIDLLVKSTKKFHCGDIRGIESGLLGQVHTLNLLFYQFIRRGCAAYTEDHQEHLFRIAFRAQSQCRATLTSLATIKNPSPVAFVNQANISHGPQQANNGVLAPAKTPASSER